MSFIAPSTLSFTARRFPSSLPPFASPYLSRPAPTAAFALFLPSHPSFSSMSSNPTTRKRPVKGPVPSGPSSFPRRAPLPAGASSATTSSTRSASSTPGSSSSSAQQPKDKAAAAAAAPADSMARRLTRFYTANFERRPVITLCVTNCILSGFGDACAQLIPILGAAPGAPVPLWDLERTARFAMFGFSLGPLIEKWNRFLEHRFPLRPLSSVFPAASSSSQNSPYDDDLNSPAFIEKLRAEAEKEGFRVNIDRGDSQQGQQYESSTGKGGKRTVDPQTVPMPNIGQPGQISVVALFKRVAADQLLMAPLGLAIFLSTMAILEGLEWDEIKERYSRLYWPILLVNWQIWPIVQLINFRYLPLRYRVPFSASLGVLWTVFLSFKNAKASGPELIKS